MFFEAFFTLFLSLIFNKLPLLLRLFNDPVSYTHLDVYKRQVVNDDKINNKIIKDFFGRANFIFMVLILRTRLFKLRKKIETRFS